MKTWKIITIATCSLIAVALLIVSAFAYMGGQGFYMPYGANTATTSPYGTYPNGMMGGGMMGWTTGTPAGTMTVTVEQARTNAQQFLNANHQGTTVGSVDAFYGYYHVHVLQAGNTYGMLSVNGYTGEVWYHTWHGAFVQEIELD
jgi:hypothetical protein